MWLNVVYFILSAGVWFSISWNGFLCLFWEAFLAGRWQASSSQEHCKLCTPKCITSIPWVWCFVYVPQHVYRTPSLICLWEACIRLYCSRVSVCVQFQSLHANMLVLLYFPRFNRLTGCTGMRLVMSIWIVSHQMSSTSLCKTLHSQENHCRYIKVQELYTSSEEISCTHSCLVFVTSLATAWSGHPFRAVEKSKQVFTPEGEAYICTIRVGILVLQWVFIFRYSAELFYLYIQNTIWTDNPGAGRLLQASAKSPWLGVYHPPWSCWGG